MEFNMFQNFGLIDGSSKNLTNLFFKKAGGQIQKNQRIINSAFLSQSNKIELSSKLVKKQINELIKLTTQSTLYNQDENKLNDMTNQIRDSLQNNQTSLNELQSLKNEFSQSLQQEGISKAIIEILQQRIVELFKNFKISMQKRTESIKHQEEKKNKFNFPSKGLSQTVVKRKGALFLHDENNNHYDKNHQSLDMGGQDQIGMQNQNLQNRVDSMKNIEKMITEVAGIFQRIGNIVQMQQIQIDRIDKHSEDSLLNLEKGRKHLGEIYQDTVSNRAFMLKVFLVLFIFSAVYIVFLI